MPTFRRAYAALQASSTGTAGDAAYLHLLLLAASTLQSDVDLALALLLDQGKLPTADDVKEVLDLPAPPQVPDMPAPEDCGEFPASGPDA